MTATECIKKAFINVRLLKPSFRYFFQRGWWRWCICEVWKSCSLEKYVQCGSMSSVWHCWETVRWNNVIAPDKTLILGLTWASLVHATGVIMTVPQYRETGDQRELNNDSVLSTIEYLVQYILLHRLFWKSIKSVKCLLTNVHLLTLFYVAYLLTVSLVSQLPSKT